MLNSNVLVGLTLSWAAKSQFSAYTAHACYFSRDVVDVEHLRGGHLDFDPRVQRARGLQHQRQGEEETAGSGGEVGANLTGRLPMTFGSEYLSLRREPNTSALIRSGKRW